MLKKKGEAFEAFKAFKVLLENQLGVKIKALRDDKGGEYISKAFEAFCTEHDILRQHTVRNRPQQNGVAERANRVMGEAITTMLSEASLPPSFWGECLSSFLHVWNRSPTSAVPKATPHELWFGKKPDVSHFRVWDVWLMSIFRRISAMACLLTWRDASSLGTELGIGLEVLQPCYQENDHL